MASKNPAFMSGVPELLVLRLLVAREMYGYEIARSIKIVTHEALSLGEGVLYPALHALEARRLLRSKLRRVEGRARIYYSLTARGKAHLARLTTDWEHMRQGVDSILGSPQHG